MGSVGSADLRRENDGSRFLAKLETAGIDVFGYWLSKAEGTAERRASSHNGWSVRGGIERWSLNSG